MKNKIRIKNLEKQFIRDKWGNLKSIFWNQIIKDEIKKAAK